MKHEMLLLNCIKDKYKKIHGKGISSMSACVDRVSKASDYSNLKILSPKQMLQRLPITLAKVKACSTSENLLIKIYQIIYS